MSRLVMNYGSGFVRAANYFVNVSDFPKALAYIAKADRFIDSEIKLTEFYTNYYSKTNQWTQLDSFIANTIFTHVDGWRIYLSYIISHMVDNYPDKILYYLKKGMQQYPDQDYFAYLGVGYAQEYGRREEISKLFKELGPQMQYDISSFEADLYKPMSDSIQEINGD